MTVEGLDRLKRRLARMPAHVKRATKAAIDQGAAEVVSMQKRLAPVDDGDLQGSIQAIPGRHELSTMIVAGGAATTRPVREGQSVTYDYALAQEFGTDRMPANPFFYPSYRALRRRVKSRITRAMKKAIREGGT